MNPRLIVVGIAGKAGSGKDTAARSLILLRDCHRLALGDPIKQALEDDPQRTIIKELDASGESLRWAWQTLGTECREEVYAPGLWTHLLLAKMRYLSFHHPVPRHRFVIPDVRYKIELAMIGHQVRLWGGSFGSIRLSREQEEIAESGHTSETECDRLRVDRDYHNRFVMDDMVATMTRFFDDVAAGRVRGSYL